MSAEESDDPECEANRWHDAIVAGDVDWNALTDWLEADPAHREAFADIAQVHDMLDRASGTGARDGTHVAGLPEWLIRR